MCCLFTGGDWSLVFWIKASASTPGTFVSYTKFGTFEVYNDASNNVTIHFNGQEYGTGAVLDEDQWNQVALVYSTSDHTLDFYHYKMVSYIHLKQPYNVKNNCIQTGHHYYSFRFNYAY